MERKNAQIPLMSFSYLHEDRQPDSRTCIYPALDKRSSPIISTMCGPNKGGEVEVGVSKAILSTVGCPLL